MAFLARKLFPGKLGGDRERPPDNSGQRNGLSVGLVYRRNAQKSFAILRLPVRVCAAHLAAICSQVWNGRYGWLLIEWATRRGSRTTKRLWWRLSATL